MNEDRHIGISTLANTVDNMTELLEDRNKLLQSMFKEDVYNDFLMEESAQGGAGGAGIDDSISAVGGASPNLSVPMMPDRREYVNVQQASGGGNVGGASPNPSSGTTQKFNRGGMSSPSSLTQRKPRMSGFNPQEKSSTKSLAETGFDDTVEKKISNKLETDFQIDPRLKKAFGDSLALPLKAAGAALMGLIAKIPNIVPMISNVGNFITKIGSSLGLFNTSSTDNSTSNLAQNTSKYNLTEETSGKNGYYHPDDGVMRRFMPFSKPLASESPAAKRSKGINTYPGGGEGGGNIVSTVKNFFGLAKDKNHQVSPETMMGGVVNNLQKRRLMIEMFGDENIGGGTTGGLMNIMNDLTSSMSTIQSGDSFKNISKNLVTNMSGIANSNSTKSMISELTNNVINEGNALINEQGGVEGIKEQMTGMIQKAGAAIPNLNMESGGSMAISVVKQSPFFTEYANTAQFS